MIPTALVAGLVVGRWWVIPLIGLGWTSWLIVDGSCRGNCSTGAFLLACANTAVGVAIHRGIRSLLRRRDTKLVG